VHPPLHPGPCPCRGHASVACYAGQGLAGLHHAHPRFLPPYRGVHACRWRQLDFRARKLDDSFQRAHPEIPWSGTIGARNIVMHAYEYIRPELIRDMAEKDVPELLAHCLRLLGQE
jgi:hypothetical protein